MKYVCSLAISTIFCMGCAIHVATFGDASHAMPSYASPDWTPSFDEITSYFRFENTLVDSIGDVDLGNLTNGASFSLNGKIDAGSVEFDGVDDSVDLGLPNSLIQMETFTISTWIKVPSAPAPGTYPHIYGQRNLLKRRVVLAIDGDMGGAPFLSVFDSSDVEYFAESNQPIPFNEWVHFVATFDNTGDRLPRVYINGVEVSYLGQIPLSGTMQDGSNVEVSLGNRFGGGRPFLGKIDEILIWSKVLTAVEILEIYNHQSQSVEH